MPAEPGYPPPQATLYSQQPYRPPQRRFPVWAMVLISCCCCAPLLIVPVLSALLFPVFAQVRSRIRERACLSYLKIDAQAIALYTQDYDEHLPPSRVWMDGIQPFISQVPKVRGRDPLHCPEAAPLGKSDWQVQYGYAFDSRLSQKSLANIASHSKTRLIYDSTNLARNASDPGASIAYRHERRANVGFIDGHVEWVARSGASEDALDK